MKAKDFKEYLKNFGDEEELTFHVCFTDSTDSESTQDWFPLELVDDEAPEHLSFVFASLCEKDVFEIFKNGLEE